MIKGRKISDANVKVNLASRNQNKEQGITVTNTFKPQKIEIGLKKIDNQILNEEDQDSKVKIVEEKSVQCQKTHQSSCQQTTLPKRNQQKVDTTSNKQGKTVKQQKQLKNRSCKYITSKKQNKRMNQKQQKETKQSDSKKSKCQKNNSQQKGKEKEKQKQIQKQQEKEVEEVRSIKIEMIKEVNEEIDCSRNQFLQEVDQYQELQAERMYLPIPIIQTQGQVPNLQIKEISFQDNDFQQKLPSQPILYHSSEEQQEDSTQIDPAKCLSYQEQMKNMDYLTQGMNHELFSLSAQELLQKEYFNVV